MCDLSETVKKCAEFRPKRVEVFPCGNRNKNAHFWAAESTCGVGAMRREEWENSSRQADTAMRQAPSTKLLGAPSRESSRDPSLTLQSPCPTAGSVPAKIL